MGTSKGQGFGIGITALVALLSLAVIPAVAVVATHAAPAGAAASCPPPASQLENNGFESPRITTGTFQIIDQSTVPGWSTTAADGKMELWNSGFQGVPAAEGLQFAELNANLVSTLYQDIPTTPGQTLIWGLSHRGRQGVDTMNVRIGVPGGSLTVVATVSNGNSAWGRHTGSYVVPTGQTVTRFAFESVSAAGGNKSIGNFLDAISFGTPACVTAEKSVLPSGSVNVNDQINYNVAVTNRGGSATTAASVSDVIPNNTTFVPGSITVNTGTGLPIAVPDSAYSAGTRTISVNLRGSSGTVGVLEPGTTVTLNYAVTADLNAAGTTLLNTASISATDGLGAVDTFTTNQTSTQVNAAADLRVDKSATSQIASGGTITYSLTVVNDGPSNVGSTITVTDTLPTGVTFVSASAGCSAVAQVVTCTTPSLNDGASTNFTITATGNNAGPDPIVLVNPATVSSAVHDWNETNNTSEAATVVDPQAPAELLVTKTALTPTVNAGRRASVSMLVTNIGQSASGTVTLTDTIPPGFTAETVIAPIGTCTIGVTLSCNLGVLAAGDTVRVILVGRTQATLNAGATLVDTATATDGTLTDSDSATITVANASRLVTTKETLNTPQADEPLRYGVTVTNLGPSDADNAIVTDALPAGVTLLETPAGCNLVGVTLTCTIGTLAVGDSIALNYPVSIPVAGGTFVNTATATSDSTNPNPGDATASTTTNVASGADLAITKVASVSEVRSGGSVTYTLTVTNQGPGTATSVEVNDVVGSGIDLTAASTSTGTITLGGDPFWSIGNLPAGLTATATVTATVTGNAGDYDNTAFVFASSEDPDGSDNTSVARVTIPGRGGAIAATGAEALPLTGTGTLFLASGSALLAWARRRGRRPAEPTCLD